MASDEEKERWRTDPQAAFDEATRLVDEAIAEREDWLDFFDWHALTTLPPQIATMWELRRLDLDNTRISDLSVLSDLTGLQQLYLNNTRISDISALSGLTGLLGLDLDNTRVVDLRPVLNMPKLKDDPFAFGLTFKNTPACDAIPALREVAEIVDAEERAAEVFRILEALPEDWVPFGDAFTQDPGGAQGYVGDDGRIALGGVFTPNAEQAAALAKLLAAVDQIRADDPDALTPLSNALRSNQLNLTTIFMAMMPLLGDGDGANLESAYADVGNAFSQLADVTPELKTQVDNYSNTTTPAPDAQALSAGQRLLEEVAKAQEIFDLSQDQKDTLLNILDPAPEQKVTSGAQWYSLKSIKNLFAQVGMQAHAGWQLMPEGVKTVVEGAVTTGVTVGLGAVNIPLGTIFGTASFGAFLYNRRKTIVGTLRKIPGCTAIADGISVIANRTGKLVEEARKAEKDKPNHQAGPLISEIFPRRALDYL